MEDYTNILKLEDLTIKYQKKAETSRNWVHHLQVVSSNFVILTLSSHFIRHCYTH